MCRGWSAANRREECLALADGIQVFHGLDEAADQAGQQPADESPTREPGQVPPDLARITESFALFTA